MGVAVPFAVVFSPFVAGAIGTMGEDVDHGAVGTHFAGPVGAVEGAPPEPLGAPPLYGLAKEPHQSKILTEWKAVGETYGRVRCLVLKFRK